MKILARKTGRSTFLKNCPEQYDEMMKNIDELVFLDKPDYSYFYRKLKEICTKNNVQMNDPFDWSPQPILLNFNTNKTSAKTQNATSTTTQNINETTSINDDDEITTKN